MNLEFYRNFVKIAECGTLSEASRQLLIAQPALSVQVRRFEEEYGAELFVREARQMTLTDAGKILYDKAKSILNLEDAAKKEIEACVSGAQGTLRLGMTQAFPDPQISGMLLSFRKENPAVHFEFFETSSGEILEKLRTGEAEIGIVRLSGLLPSDMEEQVRIPQKLCVCARTDNPWLSSAADRISTRSLHKVPLAVSRGFEQTLREIFQRDQVQPEIVSVSTSRMNPLMWAEAGQAAAVLCTGPQADDEIGPGMFVRPIYSENEEVRRQLQATRSIVTLRDRTLSRTAVRFLDHAARTLSGAGEESHSAE